MGLGTTAQVLEADYTLIASLREQDILLAVDGHRLEQTQGVILVSCGDGDQFVDLFVTQTGLQICRPHSPRVHTFAWNGGALRLDNTIDIGNVFSVFLQEILDACVLKDIGTVALYAHYPCGKAALAHMTLLDVLRSLIRAKFAVKQARNNEGSVACFFHVNYLGDDIDKNPRKRTYFVDVKKFVEVYGLN